MIIVPASTIGKADMSHEVRTPVFIVFRPSFGFRKKRNCTIYVEKAVSGQKPKDKFS